MAFSFGLPLVQPDPNGGGVDLGAALARLSGQGDGGYAPQAPQPAPQAAAPQPQPQQQAQQGSPYDIHVSPLEATMAFLAHGGTPAEAAQHVRAVKLQNMMDGYAIQQAQLRSQALQNAGPDEQRAVLYGDTPIGKAFADRFATHALKGGETLVNGGAAGSPFTATTYGMDPSGFGYALGPSVPGGLALSAGRAPGETKVDAESGGLYNNNGPIAGQQFSRWRTFEPQQTAGDSFGGVRGGVAPGFPVPGGLPAGPLQLGVSAAAGGAPQGAPVTPNGAPSANAPLGIRNNNFGNLMALPNGQQWKGQVGVDPRGYAVFATPQDGVNAATTNLQSYATKHGINTVAGVVSRWAPAGSNNTSNYIHYVAGSMGVDPNQPLNMSDPNVQKGLTSGIFAFENGPQAMAALGSQPGAGPAPASPQQVAQNGDAAPSFSAVHQGQAVRDATPAEIAARGYPAGTVGQIKPDGSFEVKQSGYGPEQMISMRNAVAKDPAMENYHNALDAWGAMTNSARQPNGGMRAYALRDTFARLINPGAVARVGTIEALKESQGVPANIQAYLMNLKGDGDVPPDVAQQIMDIAHGFLASHYSTVKRMNDGNADFARKVGIQDPSLIQAPLDNLPGRFSIAAARSGMPQQDELVAGHTYKTPRGTLKWTGTGFVPAGGR